MKKRALNCLSQKVTKANYFYVESALRCYDAGITVDWDNMPSVTISCQGEEDIFMQGDDAEQFQNEIELICKRLPSMNEYTAALSIAEQYVECIWG